MLPSSLGAFSFRAIRRIHGKWTTVTGVVLGQPGLASGFAAAAAMVDRISGRRPAPDPQQPGPPPGRRGFL